MVEKIFTPVTIGDFTVQHRIVLAPLTRFRADEDQVPKKCVEEYYEQRATCQGFLVTEATSIHKDAARFEGSPGIYSEKQVIAWKEVTTRVHQKGGKIFAQLWHVGRATHSSLIDGKQPVSSSAVQMTVPVRGKYTTAVGRRESEVPRALLEDEIPDFVNQYVTAAQNAMRAGFDGIEIHGANGYLVDQFLRDETNKRTDSYGGTIDKRCKFVLEVIAGIAEKIGIKRLGIRFSPFGTFNSMSDSNPVALFSHLFQKINKLYANLAYIHLTDYDPNPDPLKSNEDLIGQLRKVWKGKLILNLNRLSREKAIQIIDNERADLVAIGRDFIANPDLPLRLSRNYALNTQDPTTFYTHDAEGYTDYPFYKSSQIKNVTRETTKRDE